MGFVLKGSPVPHRSGAVPTTQLIMRHRAFVTDNGLHPGCFRQVEEEQIPGMTRLFRGISISLAKMPE
jgi:hypothetical protein